MLGMHVFFIYCDMIYVHAYIVHFKIRQLIVPGIACKITREIVSFGNGSLAFKHTEFIAKFLVE